MSGQRFEKRCLNAVPLPFQSSYLLRRLTHESVAVAPTKPRCNPRCQPLSISPSEQHAGAPSPQEGRASELTGAGFDSLLAHGLPQQVVLVEAGALALHHHRLRGVAGPGVRHLRDGVGVCRAGKAINARRGWCLGERGGVTSDALISRPRATPAFCIQFCIAQVI